ncbi:hypothetical protein M1271_05645 [Patescibacteria group bacterium]|nr:hypothetical protein [Patescibacteria group bacterium]MCL5797732.1 hypothetical protein [Patescibacteria group bacterium]
MDPPELIKSNAKLPFRLPNVDLHNRAPNCYSIGTSRVFLYENSGWSPPLPPHEIIQESQLLREQMSQNPNDPPIDIVIANKKTSGDQTVVSECFYLEKPDRFVVAVYPNILNKVLSEAQTLMSNTGINLAPASVQALACIWEEVTHAIRVARNPRERRQKFIEEYRSRALGGPYRKYLEDEIESEAHRIIEQRLKQKYPQNRYETAGKLVFELPIENPT